MLYCNSYSYYNMVQHEKTVLKWLLSIKPTKFCEYMELSWQRL